MLDRLNLPKRRIFDEEHEAFRDLVRAFIQKEVQPNFEAWESNHRIDRDYFLRAGELGLLLFAADEQWGGQGMDDFRLNAIINEEFGRANYASAGLTIALQNDVLAPYFLELGDDDQKARWVPGMASGELMAAIGMTEPSTGSDLAGIRTSARREGNDWIISGSKTFISSGQNADLIVVGNALEKNPSLLAEMASAVHLVSAKA